MKGTSTTFWRDLAIALGISLLAALPFLVAGVSGNFINYDDPEFVTSNPQVLQGLSLAGARWAFTTFQFSSWHPLTWLSHMLDATLFGLDARGHHAMNILLHALNAGLLFLALRRMTGALWRSALVAALFGVHPLHVESVAWIAERKDVLSGLFFMLVLLAWERYARRGGARRYLAALALFALGLMAKPMLVTLPFVLLLLDVWPLGRTPLSRDDHPHPTGWGPILLEKIPFLALTALSSAVTLLAQQAADVTRFPIPLGERLANAIVSYAAYLAATFWPARLAVLYPFPASPIPWPAVAASALILALLSLAALLRLSRQPYLAVGWCWFVGMLVPVIGFVQVGAMARADRWTYLPLIGVFIGVVWFAAEGLPASLRLPKALGTLAAGVVAACVAVSAVQAGYWRDSISLYLHTLSVTENNLLIHNNVAAALNESGRQEEALSHCLEAIRLDPGYPEAYFNCGLSLTALGRNVEAVDYYRKAIRLKPNYADAYSNLGISLLSLGKNEDAIAQFREAIRTKPDFAKAYNNLGVAFVNLRLFSEAAQSFRGAIGIDPDYAEAYNNLGYCLYNLGWSAEAVQSYREAIRIKPDYANAHYNLGNSLVAFGNFEEAVQSFREAIRIKPENANAHCRLGNALIALGRDVEAAASFREALRIDPYHKEALAGLSHLAQRRRSP